MNVPPQQNPVAAPDFARRLFERFEPLHAVVYFSSDVAEAMRQCGLQGYWMGYFAGRACPLGEASPELVHATFYNFPFWKVARALPDAWKYASPAQVWEYRLVGLEKTLHHILHPIDIERIHEAVSITQQAIAHCSPLGRPLYASTSNMSCPENPLLQLWFSLTLLREHRGDSHVAALLSADLSGLEAHILSTTMKNIPKEIIFHARDWKEEEWVAAQKVLFEKGYLTSEGSLTQEGAVCYGQVERTTDHLSLPCWKHLDLSLIKKLISILDECLDLLDRAGLIPYPNPMGVGERKSLELNG